MNLKEVREYTESLIKSYFKPKVLKKFDEDTNGNLTYDGNPMSAKVSGKSNNAIQTITDTTTPSNGGLFVKDLSEEVKRINIAQKTVNNPSWELISNDIIIQATPSTENGKVNSTDLNIDEVLLKSIEDYEFLDFYIQPIGTTAARSAQIVRVSVNTIIYNNSNTFSDNDGSCFSVQFNYHSILEGLGGARHASLVAYFKNPTTLRLYQFINTFETSDANKFKIWVKGVYTDRITIDPVNYIDTTQGIQDVPVGTLINTEGPQNPDHYLLCDGTEYNIVDYRDLAEAIKKVYGSYNYFGGDGTNTFAVPKYVDTNKWFSPKQTSNSNPYNVSASSSYSSWQIWWGFNNNCTTSASNAWHSAVGSTTGHWVQIDFKAIKSLSGISMAPRPEGNYNVSRMPRDFDIMGSNDGTTWNIIKSYTGINDYENYKYREFIFDRPEKYRYYRIANIVVTGDCVNIADIHFLEAPEKYIYIKATPTYFIGGVNGYEEIRNLTNGFIDLTLGTLNYKTTLLESIENFDKVEATIEGTWASTGTKLGLKTHYFNVADIKERYVSDGNWKHGNQLNYIDTIINRDFNYITAIFMNDKIVNLSCYGDTSNISALHIRLRGIVNHYKVKSTN